MAKFKKGDKVRIRVDTSSPFRGRIGIVDSEPTESANLVGYMVKLESKGNTSTCLFDEQVLETMTDT
jgi:transcription antitermination factor NusG